MSGYGLAFAIISLIVAIPYVILRRGVSEAKPIHPSTAESGREEGGEGVEHDIVAAAVAAALYVHEMEGAWRRGVKRYSPISGWSVASRLDTVNQFEEGWGARRWRASRC